MARDSGGTYSLYTPGNPVVSGTIISSSWANNTLTDLATAMTDSLARSGQGGMLAQLKLFAGTIGSPGLSWTAETTSGLYRAGAGDFRYAIAGVDIWKIAAGGISAGFADGSVGSPSIYFAADTDTGIYRAGANLMRFATGGLDNIKLSPTFATFNFPLLAQSGAVGAPSFTFEGDTDSGFWRVGADRIALSIAGATTFDVSTTFFDVNVVPIRSIAGTVGAPAHTFSGDPDTGLYNPSTNQLGLAAGGALQAYAIASPAQFRVQTVLAVQDGTNAAPTVTFISDPDTGMYLIAGNTLGFATGGGQRIFLDGAGLTMSAAMQFYVNDGGAGNPAITFTADQNTGIYRLATDTLAISGGAVTLASFGPTVIGLQAPLFQVNGIHNGTAPTGAANQYIASGTYVPTITATTNVDASTAQTCRWIRVGNVVSVWGTISVDCTAAVATQFSASLPIASNLAGGFSLTGQGHHRSGPPFVLVSIIEGTAADTAIFQWTATATTLIDLIFGFSYLML